MSSKEIKGGAFLSYAQMGLSVLIGIVYTPIMLKLLGQSEYGLYSTVVSTISMLSMLSLGFGSSYIRYFSKYRANGDQISINRLNGLLMSIFGVIGVIVLICGIFISNHLELLFDTGLSASEYHTAKSLVLLMTINLAVTLGVSLFTSIIQAYERFIFLKIVGILSSVANPVISLPLLIFGAGAMGMGIAALSVTLISNLVIIGYCFKRLHVAFDFRKWQKGLLKSLFAYTSFIALNAIVDQINWNIDKVLLGRVQGTAAVATYSIGYALYSYYMQISLAVSSVFTPRIHSIENSSDSEITKNFNYTQLMVRVGRIQFLILGLVLCGLIFFGKQFIYYWAGTGYENAYYVCLLLSIPATVPLVQNVGIEIQRAKNKHQFRSVIYAGMAILNLAISIFFCQLWGEIGCAAGTAVSLIVANGFVMNAYYKHLGININEFWKQIVCAGRGVLLPILFGVVLNRFFPAESIFMLGGYIAAFTGVYVISIWFTSLNTYEKNLIKGLHKKVARKHA